MHATKVSENGETLKKMKAPPSLSHSVETAMNELSEIKKFVDGHQINDWFENELNICFTKIHEVKERMGTMFTHQLLDRGLKVVLDSESISPAGMLDLSLTSHHFFDMVSPIYIFSRFHFKLQANFQFLKPHNLTNVYELPVPSETRSITFHKDFNGPINSNNLPPHILSLDFSLCSFNSRLDLLPSTITKLTLGNAFDLVIKQLPKSLTHLTFGAKFDHPISCLPESLNYLEFGTSFNSPLGLFPNKLIKLRFCRDFNQPLPSLPSSLQVLSFSKRSNFNQPLSLPPLLSRLRFKYSCKFNQKLEIPKTLSRFSFNVEEYNHSLKLDHCSNLTSLKIGISTEGPNFNFSLPINTITELHSYCDNHHQEYLLPSLTSLEMSSGQLDSFPSLPHLTTLSFDTIELNFTFSNLHPSLTSLTIDHEYFLPIDHQLPPSLTYLYIYKFHNSVDHLPNNLQTLAFGELSQPIDNLPISLTSLKINDTFNHPVDNLPPFLKTLKLGNSFNRPVKHLPQTLEYLSIGNMFNFPVTKLPPSLSKLHLGHRFNLPLNILPPSLTSLKLGDSVDQEICHLPNLTHLRCTGKLTFMNPFLPNSLTTLILDLEKIPNIYLPPKLKLTALYGRDEITLNTKNLACAKQNRSYIFF